ncbi:siderophore ABC transporter substrate-binding protein [Bacillaceae bacterium Marseille-Q3522]|nr:siderophore ABC transporter substrate-binding protein [Bacillaceae bacterium Marseille-Q3522]
MKKRISLFMLIAFTFIITACGANDAAQDKQQPANSAGEAETVNVKHQLGETTVDKNPQKVVVFDYGSLDTLDALGVEVTGVSQTNVPDYLKQYEDSKYTNIGSLKEPDYEAISEIEPDLIIISSRQADFYEELSELGPTIYLGVDYNHYLDSFTENVHTLAEIFGKEEKAESMLADLNQSIEDLKAKAADLEQTSLVIMANEGEISAFGPNSRFGIIHDVLGFKPADTNIEASTHGQNISYEYIAEKNPAILFVIDRGAAIGGETSVKQVVENELVKNTDAFKDEQIVYLSADIWYLSGGGLESVQKMIDETAAVLE